MSEVETLPRAPITEAVLDIWTHGGADNIAGLRPFCDAMAGSLPKSEQRQQATGLFSLTPTGAMTTSSSVAPVGWLLRSEDGLDVAQARVDGFTANRMKPYTDWADFSSKARRGWATFVESAAPVRVPRIGLRYLNHFELPLTRPFDPDALHQYTIWRPAHVELESGSGLSDFLLSAAFEPTPSVQANLSLLSTQQKGHATTGFVLDISVSRSGDWSPDDDAVWRELDDLRSLKNRLFFASVTEKFLEMFR